jgi:hypothetical protein
MLDRSLWGKTDWPKKKSVCPKTNVFNDYGSVEGFLT